TDFAIRRVIRTRGTIADDKALDSIRRFLNGGMDPANAFATSTSALNAREPFALLHRHGEA
ncbi:hypothetical protein AB4144_37760, partial [Rhizobiaceae sp. 2RAB30]